MTISLILTMMLSFMTGQHIYRFWCKTELLTLQRTGPACVLLPDKQVMVVGGIGSETKPRNSTEQFFISTEFLNLKNMKWTLKKELPVEATSPWLVEDDGEVLLVGAGPEGNQVWSFNEDSWSNTDKNLTVGRKSGLFLTVDEDQFVGTLD